MNRSSVLLQQLGRDKGKEVGKVIRPAPIIKRKRGKLLSCPDDPKCTFTSVWPQALGSHRKKVHSVKGESNKLLEKLRLLEKRRGYILGILSDLFDLSHESYNEICLIKKDRRRFRTVFNNLERSFKKT